MNVYNYLNEVVNLGNGLKFTKIDLINKFQTYIKSGEFKSGNIKFNNNLNQKLTQIWELNNKISPITDSVNFISEIKKLLENMDINESFSIINQVLQDFITEVGNNNIELSSELISIQKELSDNIITLDKANIKINKLTKTITSNKPKYSAMSKDNKRLSKGFNEIEKENLINNSNMKYLKILAILLIIIGIIFFIFYISELENQVMDYRYETKTRSIFDWIRNIFIGDIFSKKNFMGMVTLLCLFLGLFIFYITTRK